MKSRPYWQRSRLSIVGILFAVIAVVTLLSTDTTAQTVSTTGIELLKPSLDGNPAETPRFRQSFTLNAKLRLSVTRHGQKSPPLKAGSAQTASIPADPPSKMTGSAEPLQLQLEVTINGAPKNLIGSFELLPDGRIASTCSELQEIGLKLEVRQTSSEVVMLNDLPGLTYRYDERTQQLFITAPIELLTPTVIDLRPTVSEVGSVRADYGAVLNYDLLTTTNSTLTKYNPFGLVASSLTLDARVFTPFGTLSQSGIVLSSPQERVEWRRLNSTFSNSNQDIMVTSRAGDTISGGLAWTRPIRIGGYQAQRDFGLRPDLVTMPLPSINGGAAVPSSVDLYINNLKTFSQNVAPGPFTLNNIPMVSGAGTASVIVNDAGGHQATLNIPFYSSPSLLAPGLSSFSVEAGLPRIFYGTPSDGYVDTPIASATLRKGIFDWLTVEGHAEGGAGLLNGGVGAVLRTGSIGVASSAVTVSRYAGGAGVQTFFGYETKVFEVTISASSQMTFGCYDDLASVTASMQPLLPSTFGLYSISAPSIFGQNTASQFVTALPPKLLNRLTFGIPVSFDVKSSISASAIQQQDGAGNRSDILALSWSRALPYDASVYATAFTDVGSKRNTGVFAGISIPLNDNIFASSSVTAAKQNSAVTTDLVKPLAEKPGSWGWSLRSNEGYGTYRDATVSYRSSFGRVRAGVGQDANGATAAAEVEGAVAAVGGGVFFANRIDDSFAVVDTDVANVEVFQENRPIGTTNSRGQLLVPSLRSYQKNKISIDARNLPVDAEIDTTQSVVTPADRSGVIVKFGIQKNTQSAVVVFVGKDGKQLPAGSHGKTAGGEEFVVGYDGKAFIKNLNSENIAIIELANTSCTAKFNYTPRPNEQIVIPGTICE